MPRVYKRVSNRGTTPVDVLERAAKAVDGGRKIRKVAREFNCDRMTLTRFLNKRAKNELDNFGYRAVSNSHAVFSSNMESELASHVKSPADQFHGISLEKCRKLAFEFAIANNVTVPENWQRDQKAGKDWWHGFKTRNDLAIRRPEATSMARATAFNEPVVNQFYDNLNNVYEKYRFEGKDVYNLDETGCTTVQVPSSVVTLKGKKQVGAVTSGERGQLVTVLYAVSATGNVIPPLFIFPRVNYRNHFIKGGPPGSIGRATRTGWINEEVFVNYLHHLAYHTRCSLENKIVVVMDNHESHISLAAIDYARQKGIVLLTIPPHSSHKLQPLDKTVYGPFKKAFNSAMDCWLRSHPGRTVTIYEIPELVNEAQMMAITSRNIISGFKSTGIFPYNRNLFSDVDFAPSNLTDRPLELLEEASTSTSVVITAGVDEDASSTIEQPNIATARSTDHLPRFSSSMDTTRSPSQNLEAAYVSPSALAPLPKANFSSNPRRRRKRGSTRVVTDTPVRNAIAETSARKRQKKNKKETNAKRKILKKKRPANCNSETSDSSESLVPLDDGTYSDVDNDLMEGDFVIVQVFGAKQSKFFIARVDLINDDDYEGVFLKRLPKKLNGYSIFVPDESDEASFAKNDVAFKLPMPKQVGGTKRRECQLIFHFDTDRWQVE